MICRRPFASAALRSRWERCARPIRLPLATAAAAVALTLAGQAILPAPAAAQSAGTPFSWAAKVDDEIITGYDVAQRARLLKLETRSPDDAALLIQAREELIEESLKRNEAKRRGVTLEESQVEEALQRVARNNGVDKETFLSRLEKAGVDRSTFERRVRVQLAWNDLLRRGHLTKIRPSDGEVAAEMEAAEALPSGPKRYDVKQIVVDLAPTARGREVEKALREAVAVRNRLKSCSQIPQLAKQYSRISGDVGVLTAQQMPGPVRKAVTALQPGQTTKPMRSQNGWHVIMLCGVSASGGGKPSEERIKDLLTAKKAENVSRSLVADLRRDALIELAQ